MILCCGEALIDMVPVEGVDGLTTYAPLSGGAIFNTAIALGRLEVPVQFMSGISTDLFGEQLVRELRASGVGTKLLSRSKRPTTLAFVKLVNGHAQYTFYDENTAGRMLRADRLPDVGPDIKALYFGGISLCAEPAANAYEELAIRESAHKVLMIDPNIRTGFIEDEDTYRARLNRIIAVTDIVKVSDEDLDWMRPENKPLNAKVADIHRQGAGLVIVTKGRDGASAYIKGRDAVNVNAPKVTVADTVGAGDTFNAGFLAELHNMDLLCKQKLVEIGTSDIVHALEYAAKVAAITVSRSGADSPYLAELLIE